MNQATLKRSLGPALLTFYGLGNILGAGIYVLLGKVAGSAGLYTPAAFVVASLVAAVTALSYAELSARIPLSAGEAVYVQRAFESGQLSRIVGLLIAFAGMVSAATIARGFAGYVQVFAQLPDWTIIAPLVVILGAVAAVGIGLSVRVAALITLLEIAGLLLIVYVTADTLRTLPERLPDLLPPPDVAAWRGIMIGAFLAFYAYIGFEDMVNVAEEVHRPHRDLPLAIVTALMISTVLYLVVAIAAILAIPPQELALSDAPLALLYRHATGLEPVVITQIALLSVVNGALIQIIMASRMLYGMSRQGWLPARLGNIDARTHTPLLATLLVSAVILFMALWFPLEYLAKATSYIILIVFSLVNAALWIIKGREASPPGIRVYPRWLPLCGLLLTVGLLTFELAAAF